MNYGEEPALMLHRNRKAKIRTQRIICPDTHVRKRAASRNEFLANLLVAEKELQTDRKSTRLNSSH